MYHLVRSWHRWAGLVAALFLLIISITGFLLATKSTFGWIRPPESKGAKLESLSEVVSVHTAAQSAFALGIPELRSDKDIDRIDYRPKSNVFKVVSKEGYHEVQVDGSTGEVMQIARRVDQMAEDFHDLSFFSDLLKQYALPVVALLLLVLSGTGLGVFGTPYVRRWRYRRRKAAEKHGR